MTFKHFHIRQVLTCFVFLICSAFSANAQVTEPDSSEIDSADFHDLEIENNTAEGRKLWDTSRAGVITLPYNERQTLCIRLIDGEHCCFEAPCRGRVTSNFGWRNGRIHAGIDIDLETGDPVYAAFDGIVRQAGWNNGYGYYVIISHFNGLETLYGHLSTLKIMALQPVKSGQMLGYGGNTGHSRGSHLHFETRYFGKPINPKLLIDFEDYSLHTDSLVISHASTFSKSNFINDAPSIVQVMSDTLYAKKEAQYEANRLKISKENEKNRRAIEKKRKEKEAKKEKDRIKKAKVLYHSVKRGDTLYSIARKYGTTVDKICKMNKMKSTDILDLGRKLKVK